MPFAETNTRPDSLLCVPRAAALPPPGSPYFAPFEVNLQAAARQPPKPAIALCLHHSAGNCVSASDLKSLMRRFQRDRGLFIYVASGTGAPRRVAEFDHVDLVGLDDLSALLMLLLQDCNRREEAEVTAEADIASIRRASDVPVTVVYVANNHWGHADAAADVYYIDPAAPAPLHVPNERGEVVASDISLVLTAASNVELVPRQAATYPGGPVTKVQYAAWQLSTDSPVFCVVCFVRSAAVADVPAADLPAPVVNVTLEYYCHLSKRRVSTALAVALKAQRADEVPRFHSVNSISGKAMYMYMLLQGFSRQCAVADAENSAATRVQVNKLLVQLLAQMPDAKKKNELRGILDSTASANWSAAATGSLVDEFLARQHLGGIGY